MFATRETITETERHLVGQILDGLNAKFDTDEDRENAIVKLNNEFLQYGITFLQAFLSDQEADVVSRAIN